MFINTVFGIVPLIRLEFFRECSKGCSLELNQAIDIHSRIPATAGIKAFFLASLFPLDLDFFYYTSFYNLPFAMSDTLEISL